MLIIQHVAKKIRKSLKDAHESAEDALKYKDKYPELAKLMNTQAEQKRMQAMALPDQVRKLIESYKASGKEAPEGMMARWEYAHEVMMEMDADLVADIEKFKK